MEFEYDPRKSDLNKAKHGIDFEEAKALWKDNWSLEVPSDYEGEERSLVIGLIDGTGWTAIITHRFESIRLISVRRWRDHEAKAYDNRRRAG